MQKVEIPDEDLIMAMNEVGLPESWLPNLMRRSRAKIYVEARQQVAFALKKMGYGHSAIGRKFKRHCSTIMNLLVHRPERMKMAEKYKQGCGAYASGNGSAQTVNFDERI